MTPINNTAAIIASMNAMNAMNNTTLEGIPDEVAFALIIFMVATIVIGLPAIYFWDEIKWFFTETIPDAIKELIKKVKEMSSKAKSLRKSVNGDKFPNEMYNTLLGSFLVSLYILQKTDATPVMLAKFYKLEKERWLKDEVSEDKWMHECIERLNEFTFKNIYKYTKKDTMSPAEIPYGQIAFVQSQYNALIAPYIQLKPNEEPRVLALREDGFRGITLETGKIYPIVEEEDH